MQKTITNGGREDRPEGTIQRRCAEIVRILDTWTVNDRTNDNYGLACRQIEAAVEKAAAARSLCPDGVRAKAQAVLRLNTAGVALASGRLLASSLAQDVLGGEG
jgi:hypothetical protein